MKCTICTDDKKFVKGSYPTHVTRWHSRLK
jgi:hypothetical protein